MKARHAYRVVTRTPGESYLKRIRSLLLSPSLSSGMNSCCWLIPEENTKQACCFGEYQHTLLGASPKLLCCLNESKEACTVLVVVAFSPLARILGRVFDHLFLACAVFVVVCLFVLSAD